MTAAFLAGQPDPAALMAAIKAERVMRHILVEGRFASGTVYLADAAVPVIDGQWGHTWRGMGDLIAISDVQGGPNQLAPSRSITLGIPREYLDDEQQSVALLPSLIGNKAEYRGRELLLWLQHFDVEDLDEHGRPQPLGYPVAIDSGAMDQLSIAASLTAVTMTMTVESGLARFGYPTFGMLTYRDQLRRYPGDKGLSFVPEVASTEVTWPNF